MVYQPRLLVIIVHVFPTENQNEDFIKMVTTRFATRRMLRIMKRRVRLANEVGILLKKTTRRLSRICAVLAIRLTSVAILKSSVYEDKMFSR